MNNKPKLVIVFLIAINVALFLNLLTRNHNFALFNPQGLIAMQEFDVLRLLLILSLCVVIPVFILTFFIAYKYRATNAHATFTPEKTHTTLAELGLWAIPAIIILMLAPITWNATHAVDPYKPIINGVKPITVQVVALRWKWLFIYPEQGIATVNFLEIPVGTPINFELTADDTPMNSFWIPQLGGQMYSMAGMASHLHLVADKAGTYTGSNAEINGKGFAEMKFITVASSPTDFASWVASIKQSSHALTTKEYNKLAQPSTDNPKIYYSSVNAGLYADITMKYMTPNQH